MAANAPAPHVFAGDYLDRLGGRRTDSVWLARVLAGDEARALAVWSDRCLVDAGADSEPVLLPLAALPDVDRDELVMLGRCGDHVCFAADVGEGPATPAPHLGRGRFEGLRRIATLMSHRLASLCAYAQAMVQWHRRHRFCGRCGSRTVASEAGHVRRCSNGDCAERLFPRLDPAIIVLVSDGERALLGRQPAWPAGVYSTIAGFVEPGESLEDAVRREVAEESGVLVGEVRYHSSQPWPFPSSLMLGFMATAADTRIERRDEELEDVRWFTREEVAAGIDGGLPRLPFPLSISYHLVAHWFDDDEPGRLAKLQHGRTLAT